MNNLRTASGRQLRGAALHETPLPIEYDATFMPGVRLLGEDGQIYESIKNQDSSQYEWTQRGPGPSVELQKTTTEIQWRVAGENDPWTTLVLLEDLEGPRGLDGLPGAGLSFQGSVAAVEDLPATSTTGYGFVVEATDDIWVWDGATWINMGPAVQGPPGPQGDQGVPGADGAAIELRKTLSDLEWRLAGQSAWTAIVALEDLKGPVGDDGAEGPAGPGFSYRGSVATVGGLPIPSTQGYAYKVDTSEDVYIYNGLSWVNAGPLKGPKGDTGDQGVSGPVGPGFSFRGSVATAASLPIPSIQGYAYKVEATNDLYIYNGSSWVNSGSVQGPKGDQGDPGDEGPQGPAGSSFSFRGSVATVAALPSPSITGYAYKVDSTGDLHIYNGLVWVNAGPLEGAKGDQGDTGPAGAGFSFRGNVSSVASLPTPSTTGYGYKVASTGDLHIFNGTDWVNAGPLQGPAGPIGDEGPMGPQGLGFSFQGSLASVGALPTPSTQGFAYRIGTDLYIYNGASWVNAGQLQGPKGDQGDQGNQGPTGASFSFQGSVATVGSLPLPATTGYAYKVESTGDLYIYNGSSWVSAGPLQGSQGIQGIQGVQGPAGISPYNTDGLSEGSANLYFTTARARTSVGASGALSYNATTGVFTTSAVTSVTGTAPIVSSGGTTPEISISAATTSAAGSMSSTDKTKLDGVATGATANSSDATLLNRGNHTGTQLAATIGDSTTAGRALLTAADAAAQLTALGLGTSGTPQFGGLGLGTAAVSGWELTMAGGTIQNRSTITAASNVYTLDVTAANEFLTSAAIAAATTINLSNLASIPAGYVWRAVLSFAYTSGTISWFTGNAGYTVKWDGGTAMTPTASEVEKVVIEVVGGTTTIEVAPLKGRA